MRASKRDRPLWGHSPSESGQFPESSVHDGGDDGVEMLASRDAGRRRGVEEENKVARKSVKMQQGESYFAGVQRQNARAGPEVKGTEDVWRLESTSPTKLKSESTRQRKTRPHRQRKSSYVADVPGGLGSQVGSAHRAANFGGYVSKRRMLPVLADIKTDGFDAPPVESTGSRLRKSPQSANAVLLKSGSRAAWGGVCKSGKSPTSPLQLAAQRSFSPPTLHASESSDRWTAANERKGAGRAKVMSSDGLLPLEALRSANSSTKSPIEFDMESPRNRIANNLEGKDRSRVRSPRSREAQEPGTRLNYGAAMVKLGEESRFVTGKRGENALEVARAACTERSDTLSVQLYESKVKVLDEIEEKRENGAAKSPLTSREMRRRVIAHSEVSGYQAAYHETGKSHVGARKVLQKQSDSRATKFDTLRHMEQMEDAVRVVGKVKYARDRTQGQARGSWSMRDMVRDEFELKLEKKLRRLQKENPDVDLSDMIADTYKPRQKVNQPPPPEPRARRGSTELELLQSLGRATQQEQERTEKEQQGAAQQQNKDGTFDHMRLGSSNSGSKTGAENEEENEEERDRNMVVLPGLVRQAVLSDELELNGHDLTARKIAELCDDARLRCCRVLRVGRNNLAMLPAGLPANLFNLELFDASQNVLTCLPPDFGSFQQLKVVRLQYNRFEDIDSRIFGKLTKLKEFYMSGNSLTTIGDGIGDASRLDTLVLESNRIVTLPAAFIKLRKLRVLNMSHNCLETLAIIKPVELPPKSKIGSLDKWKQVFDQKTGDYGYVNIDTGECRRSLQKEEDWGSSSDSDSDSGGADAAADSALAEFLELEKQAKAEESTKADRAQQAQEWEQLVSEDGQTYYFNTSTSESRWDRPACLDTEGSCPSVAQLDLSKVGSIQLQNARRERARKRRKLARQGRPEWSYWINAENGRTEFGNCVTKKIVRGKVPQDLDRLQLLGNLRTLLLNGNRLTGLPPSIGKLKFLERLELGHNRLMGLPDEIAHLVTLKKLVIAENRIGTLPADIGKLKNLEYFAAGGNRLVDVPDTVEALVNLKHLDLSGNRIVTLNDRIGKLEQLQALWLGDNALLEHPSKTVVAQGLKRIMWDCRERGNRRVRGRPPPPRLRPEIGIRGECIVVEGQFHKSMNKMLEDAEKTHRLKLHFMGLRSIPEKVFRMVRLRELRISGHRQMVYLPPHLSRLRFLQVLNLAGNGLRDLPDTIAFWRGLSEHLRELDLSDNQITDVPPAISVLKRIELLALSGNRIDALHGGCFSNGLTKNLKHLRLENNRLAELPVEICSLCELQTLFLTHNMLGSLPHDFGKLAKLQKLYLSNNKLQKLPPSFGQLTSLRVFQVAHNALNALDAEFCMGPIRHSLEFLNVQANQLRELPPEFQAMSAVEQIWFDLNPIRSPPQQLHGVTWKAEQVREYCKQRKLRQNLMTRLLSGKEDFEFVAENLLLPLCQGTIIDKHHYATSQDLELCDRKLDQFVNGRYYDCTLSGYDLARKIEGRFYKRKNSMFRTILDNVIRLLETCERYRLLPEHQYDNRLEKAFGRDQEMVPCYAVKLDALFEPIKPLDKDVEEKHGQERTNKRTSGRNASNASNSSSGESDGEDSGLGLEFYSSEDEDEGTDSDEDKAGPRQIFTRFEEWPCLIERCKTLRGEHAFEFPFTRYHVENALRYYRGPYGQVAWVNAPYKFEGEENVHIPHVKEELVVADDEEEVDDEKSEEDKGNESARVATTDGHEDGKDSSKPGEQEGASDIQESGHPSDGRPVDGDEVSAPAAPQPTSPSQRIIHFISKTKAQLEETGTNLKDIVKSGKAKDFLLQESFKHATLSRKNGFDITTKGFATAMSGAKMISNRRKMNALWLRRYDLMEQLEQKIRNIFRPAAKAFCPKKKMFVFPEVNDGRKVIILAQLLYTEEEAQRRHAEEEEIDKDVDEQHEEFDNWVETDRGQSRLLTVAIERVSKAREVYAKLKNDYATAIKERNDIKEDAELFAGREKAFHEGQAFHLHRFKNEQDLVDAKEAVEQRSYAHEKRIEQLQEEVEKARVRSKMREYRMQQDTIVQVKEIIAKKARNKIIERNRLEALHKNQRRPWDGPNGSDFDFWKLVYKRKQADQGEDGYLARKKRVQQELDRDEDDEEDPYESDFEDIDLFEFETIDEFAFS